MVVMKNLEQYRGFADKLEDFADKLKIMAHPDRLRILNLLMKSDSKNGKQIYKELNMPQSTLSQHLTKLRMHQLIYGRRKGVEIYYDINDSLVYKVIGILNEDTSKKKAV